MKPRILIVEDQADIRRLIRMTLEFGDYDLIEADNGDDGYRLASTARPNVMLLDVMMPGSMDGLQVCTRLRQDPQMRDTRIIMLTARGQQSDIEAGKKAGADAYLIKPFSPLELMDLVDQYLA
ncbi:MAG: response regulator transcription factor [Zoogloea sp.]|uniref:response regulator transcription factor n=1 Tax=Zoogloea sp. TaxID=49181 RepID=UPI003F3805DA